VTVGTADGVGSSAGVAVKLAQLARVGVSVGSCETALVVGGAVGSGATGVPVGGAVGSSGIAVMVGGWRRGVGGAARVGVAMAPISSDLVGVGKPVGVYVGIRLGSGVSVEVGVQAGSGVNVGVDVRVGSGVSVSVGAIGVGASSVPAWVAVGLGESGSSATGRAAADCANGIKQTTLIPRMARTRTAARAESLPNVIFELPFGLSTNIRRIFLWLTARAFSPQCRTRRRASGPWAPATGAAGLGAEAKQALQPRPCS